MESWRRKMAGSARQVTRIVTGAVKTAVDRRDVFSLQLFRSMNFVRLNIITQTKFMFDIFLRNSSHLEPCYSREFHQPHNCLEPICYKSRNSNFDVIAQMIFGGPGCRLQVFKRIRSYLQLISVRVVRFHLLGDSNSFRQSAGEGLELGWESQR